MPRNYALYRHRRRRRRLKRLTLAVLVLTGLSVLGLSLVNFSPESPEAAETTDVTAPAPSPRATPEPARDAFGIEAATYQTSERPIRRNETFAEILAGYDVPYARSVALAEAAKPVLDVRRMQAGKSLRLYQDSASGAMQYLVYEKDPVSYVVFDLQDSVRVYAEQRVTATRERLIRGTIDQSLYHTLARQSADPALADALADLYAWQVDFQRIQKGDRFEILYEERLADGEVVGTGPVLGARLNHQGKDYYAFAFDVDGTPAYFDENGESLKKLLLKSPLKYSRISSRYSKRRFHPVQKRYKPHLGTDYAAAPGTPVRAVGDGIVLEAQRKRHNGNYVKIRHDATYTTGYLHLSRFAKGIRPGTIVRQGDLIGYVGSTGLATGPHVCYRFWKNGQQVDPLQEKLPPSAPVPEAHRAAFEKARAALLLRLRQAPPTALASF